jgi:MATE family multidrug resistance protein
VSTAKPDVVKKNCESSIMADHSSLIEPLVNKEEDGVEERPVAAPELVSSLQQQQQQDDAAAKTTTFGKKDPSGSSSDLGHEELELPVSLTDDESAATTAPWVWTELSKQVWLAGPMVCVNVLQYSLTLVSVMFVGHLGELELAGAALATSFAAVSGLALMLGMASALETLCGQAFGAKQYHMLGIYVQRAMVVLYITSIPVAVVWYNMTSLLRLLGQDPQIAEKSGEYARYLIPMLFAYATLQCLVKFLQTQSVVLSMAAFSVVTLFFHVLLCYLMMYTFGLGFHGAAVATSISYWLNVFLLVAFIKFSPKFKQTWTSFSIEAFHDLYGFLKLAIPSAVMVCLEQWSFETVVILAGLLPNPQLETSALSICLSTSTLMYMIPFGLGAATSTRVANELGAANPRGAQRAVTTALSLALVEGILIALLLLSVRNKWGYAFTNEPEVAEYVARLCILLAILQVMDAIQGVLIGMIRGCGRQTLGAIANLGSYYLLGMPTGIVLGFVLHFNAYGLWTGILLAVASQVVLLGFLAAVCDWEKQAVNAVKRVYSSAAHATDALRLPGVHSSESQIIKQEEQILESLLVH